MLGLQKQDTRLKLKLHAAEGRWYLSFDTLTFDPVAPAFAGFVVTVWTAFRRGFRQSASLEIRWTLIFEHLLVVYSPIDFGKPFAKRRSEVGGTSAIGRVRTPTEVENLELE